MNLNDINSGTPLSKGFFNPVCGTMTCEIMNADIANINDIVVQDLSANLLTLNNEVSVPNAPVLATSFWSSGSGNLSQTDPLGVTVTYTTSGMMANAVLSNGAPSVTGDLPFYDDLTGKLVSDSGIAASNVFLANGSVNMTGNLNMNSHNLNNVALIQPSAGVLFGTGASSSNANEVVIGNGASASNQNSVVLGQSASDGVGGMFGIAIGSGAVANNTSSICIAANTTNSNAETAIIGDNGFTDISSNSLICNLGQTNPFQNLHLSGAILPTGDVLFGNSISDILPGSNVLIGDSASSTNNNVVCIGPSASVQGFQSIAIGPNASSGGGGNFSIVIGRNAVASGAADIVLGQSAGSTSTGIVIGSGAQGASADSISIGRNANCTIAGTQEIALGFGATCSAGGAIAIGSPSVSSASNAISLGGSTNNATANSCLIGGGGILNIRPGNILCDLGTSVAPFHFLNSFGLKVKQGANALSGTGAVMVGGTVTVTTNAVNTGDSIFLSRTAIGGTTGNEYISAITDSTSFVISSSNALDTSTFSWLIVKPV